MSVIAKQEEITEETATFAKILCSLLGNGEVEEWYHDEPTWLNRGSRPAQVSIVKDKGKLWIEAHQDPRFAGRKEVPSEWL